MMERLKMQSLDITGSNIDKIAQLFPQCVTEHKDKDGKTVLGIDFEKLRDELSADVIDEGEERYQFTWPDKRTHAHLANTPTIKTLRPCREESVDFDHTQNLYIEGDNLDVLKVIRETYLGKVKMIYIDPPYNTGNDFVYNDYYKISKDEEESRNGTFDEDGNLQLQESERNTITNGRFHTDWLNMIYPRLKVAKDLLADDGVIFISIDDNEQANMKKVCDEIFGENNSIATFKWNRVAKAPSLSGMVRTKYEYVLSYFKGEQPHLYGKASYNAQAPLWHLPNKRAQLLFPSQSIRIPQSFQAGYYGGSYQVELLDDMEECNGVNKNHVRIIACSSWGQQKINNYVNRGKTFQIKKSPITVYIDLDSENNFIPPSDMLDDSECGIKRNTDAKEALRKMDIPFDYSKPVSLIHYLINAISYNDKNSIILDFFSGSATTAHAVMQLNAEDGGNRKFIMVQLPEKTDEKSEAYKAGYKNICEIGKERIRRAGKKIKEENADKEGIDKLDIGFRVLKLDSSNMQNVYYTPKDFTERDLFADNVKPDRTAEDLLFQVMLDLGVELSATIEQRTIDGKHVFFANDNYLVACFDENIAESTITEIAKIKPYYFVMRDSSLASDNVADNFDQLFETYSKDTIRKII